MISLARSSRITRFMQTNRITSNLAKRFIAGSNVDAAVSTAQSLMKEGFHPSLYYLGEYVDSKELIDQNITQIISASHSLNRSGLDNHLSVDPTQIGYLVSDDLGKENALKIANSMTEQSNQNNKYLMLDMEDDSYVQKTLDLHRLLRKENLPAAITIQAYLHRSEQDIRGLIELGTSVRLVKGAFVGRPDFAWTRKKDIDDHYIHLAKLLLSSLAKKNRVYPIFGTHDENDQYHHSGLVRGVLGA